MKHYIIGKYGVDTISIFADYFINVMLKVLVGTVRDDMTNY